MILYRDGKFVHESDDITQDVDTSSTDGAPVSKRDSDTVEPILAEAERLVNGDRGRDYGPPHEDYGRAVAIYHAMTGRTSIDDAADGIRFMVAVKLSRMAVSPGKRDHYVDAAGYIDCLWRTIERG